ncbi:NADPH:quinone reductase-like protein [Basidiobolus meristosporus CBS 931.73]|uniref:NADPH:quinone reductase-like protein n=1 Tax=Basidiobolus meristosporus CBS 931.73 TaxID=1314790 RepID=A0A1Y1Y634_9FUNG|nr:NADPH:quinone reductase-like protein [Basidiobolus meristosporus CBS 931.73]|eukprot:ORX93044.1 NADPH:quinone reductase-like protein [Basidiobolus meristosporus CBS 931.73]
MKAVLVKQPGDSSQLYHGETEIPQIKDHELLVKVHYFALNRMDILQREGKYPVSKDVSQILGVEMSGVVERVGASVTNFKEGDKVFGLMYGGAYAEYCAIHESMAMHLPDELSFKEAAAVPEAWCTAYQALHWIASIKKGDNVLIHAGASGVGLAAIQLAKRAGANKIFVTAGSGDKLEFCEGLGATDPINYKTESFKEKILNSTDQYGVDIIVDFIGANYWNDNIEILAKDGRMVILAFMSGVQVENFNIGPLLRKRLRIEGSTLRSRSVEYQVKLFEDISKDVIPKFINGEYKIIVDKEFSWKDIKEAHLYMEANKNTGKIVVRVD